MIRKWEFNLFNEYPLKRKSLKQNLLTQTQLWLEDKFICRLFTKETAMHDAIVKEIMAEEEKEAFKEFQKERIHQKKPSILL